MRTHLRMVVFFLSVIACSLTLLVSCKKSYSSLKVSGPEPIYKGKPLRDWAMTTQNEGFDGPSAGAIEAIEAVREIGPKAIPFLLKWIQPPCEDSRLPGGAVGAFRALGTEANSAIPELTKLLDKYKPPHSMESYGAWHCAVEVLSHMGTDALPVLLKTATNIQGQHIQWGLILRIGNFGTNGAPAIPLLIGWCHDNDSWVRLGAVNALGQIGLEPKLVVPVLRAALNDPDGLVKRDAAEALRSFVEETSVVADLIKALDSPDWEAQSGAISALGRVREQKETVVPLIIKKLQDENRIIRRVAAFSLGELGGQQSFDALMQATDDRDGFVREAVFQSLKTINPQALEKSGKTFGTSGKKNR
ncbi:MAG: HEAT repeat domain-containing protein [Verrucomicrobiota bacterium]|nr:HEAT repeat domain-containing protein [Verrucomicrobiota bacterium]